MEGAWNAVLGFGSLLGILSAAYLLLDRWTKEFPSVFIIAKPISEVGRLTAYLRVANRSERPIIVTVPNNDAAAGKFRVMQDHSIHAAVAVAVLPEGQYPVDGKETRDMPLILPADAEEMEASNTMEITVRWRYVQPILYVGDRRIRVTTTKNDLRLLLRRKEDEYLN